MEGKRGKSLNLDGTGYALVPDSPSLDLTNALTIEAWVYARTISFSHPIANKMGSSSTVAYRFMFVSTDLGGDISQDGTISPISPSIEATPYLNSWIHAALAWDGSNAKLYINGEERDSITDSGPIPDSSGSLGLGTNGDALSNFLDGMIDDVVIYNRALSQNEIQQDMNCVG